MSGPRGWILRNGSLFWRPRLPLSYVSCFVPVNHLAEIQLKPTIPDLWRYINAQKLLRYRLSTSELTPETEIQRAVQYLDAYLDGLKLGKDLPSYELQPVDDLAILAAQVLVNAWKLSGDEAPLYNAAALLEYAIGRSKMSYQIRLHLIQIYRLLGAPSLAIEHYRGIKVKQVQNDTLSHFILSRASTFSLSSMGDLTFTTECLESSRIYLSNSEEVSFDPSTHRPIRADSETLSRLPSSLCAASLKRSTHR